MLQTSSHDAHQAREIALRTAETLLESAHDYLCLKGLAPVAAAAELAGMAQVLLLRIELEAKITAADVSKLTRRRAAR